MGSEQSRQTRFSMLAGVVLLALIAVGSFFLRKYVPLMAMLLIFAAVENLAAIFITRWINTCGERVFDTL